MESYTCRFEFLPSTFAPKVHGRSREQRYTKLADWEYVDSCAGAADPMPLFGKDDLDSLYMWL